MQKILQSKYLLLAIALSTVLLNSIDFLKDYALIIALIIGIILGESKLLYQTDKINFYRKHVLNIAIIFFGFKLNIREVISLGGQGIVLSLVSLIFVLIAGFSLIKLLKIDQKTGSLITFGTGICGGSAIAATTNLIKANSKQIAVSIAIVFILNSVALVVFPPLGHLFNMSQMQFGTFAALSIHDVSSVVGASSIYGEQALEVAVVLKLTRTLWIIPIVLVLAKLNPSDKQKVQIPSFIILFIAASLVASLTNSQFIISLSVISKYLMVLALFLVGYAVKIKDLKSLGIKGIIFSVLLWIISIITSLILVFGFIN
ncbi:MAG: YeiH family protein [Mycoplasmatales bacterium]